MPKDVFSKDLNAVLTVPDNWTDEQIWAFEDAQRGNPVAGFVRGLVPGAIEGVSGMVEGVGGLTGSDTVKGLASLIRDNPVSEYLRQRTPADYSNTGRTVGEFTGNLGSMMIPGSAARAVGATGRVAKALTAAGSVAQSAGEATGEVRRNRAKGMEITPEQELGAAWAGAPLGLIETIPLNRLLGHTARISDLAKLSARDIVKRSVGTGILEAATEVAQQAGLNFGERVYNPDQDILEGLGESAVAGGGAGFTLDLLLQAAGKRAAGKLVRAVGRAKQAAPEIPVGNDDAIGIRRGDDGAAEVTASRVTPAPIPEGPIPQEEVVSPAAVEQPIQQALPPADPNELIDELEPTAPAAPQPVSKADELPLRGNLASAKVARGYSVPVEYAVVPLDQLRISNDDTGQINPAYPAELQPRQRDRRSSDEQVSGIMANLDPAQLGDNYFASDGAPIIGEDFAVESGNGRSMALRRAYASRPETAAKYQNWLAANAERFGVSPELVAATPNPVLVRVRRGLPEGISRTDFARDANEDTKAQMSGGEQALVDARSMPDELVSMFKPNENGEIVTRDNAQFITRFFDEVVPQGQRNAMRLPDGTISKAGIDRIRNAVFARAYNDRGIVERLAEDPDDNIKNVVGGLTMAAPRMIWMRSGIDSGDFFDLNPSAELTAAASKLAHLRETRLPVADYLNQMTFDQRDPLEDALLSVFGIYGRSKNDIAEVLNDYVSAVQMVGNPKQESMFGPVEPPSKLALLNAIVDEKQRRDAEAKQQREQRAQEKQAGGLDAAGRSSGLGAGASGRPQSSGGQSYFLDSQAVAASPYSVESLRAEIESGTKPRVALDLFGELQRIGVDDLVATKLVDNLAGPSGQPALGSHRDRIITLALASQNAANLKSTLNHETVHAMKEIGMFSDAEWGILQAAFRPESIMTDRERDAYAQVYQGDTARIQEEAIARGIQRYVDGTAPLSKPVSGVVDKALAVLDRIGMVARKQTAEDVVRAQQSGDIGRRALPEAAASPARAEIPAPATELPDELADMDDSATSYALSPQGKQAYGKVFVPPDERGFAQKTKEAVQDYRAAAKQGLIDTFPNRVRQSALDRRAGIEELDRSLPGGPRDAESSAIAATRFADVSGNLTTAALTKGRLEYVGTPGRGYFRASDKGDGIFRKGGTLAKLNQAGKLEELFLGMAAERAGELIGEGRENLFTPADIAIGKRAMQDPEIRQGARELKAHFDSMIDAMQASGMLTGDAAAKLKAKAYFPFYRVEVDGSGGITAVSPRGFTESIVKAPAGGGLALGNLPKLPKLKGGDTRIADPIENIARNTFALTSMAMRNVAVQRVMRDGKVLGYVKQVHNPVKTDNVVKVWINGKPRTFEVLDKVLYDSVMASGIEIGPLMRLLAVKPAQILRESVTSTPAFMVRNALRDSVQTWAQGYSAVPFSRILPGLRAAVTNAPSYDALQRLGVVGTGIRGEGAEGTAANIRGNIGKESAFHLANEARKKSLAASEGINRVAVFDEVRGKRGGSEIQAAYEALELLNFNRRGASPIAQLLGATIPFLNARAQGLDVLYRSARGKGIGGKQMKQALVRRFWALAGLSTLYTILSMGEDYYENATPEERDMYWFVPIGAGEPLKVPIPFELGVFSKILPERFTNLYFGGDNAKDLRKSMQRAVAGVMEIDLPQAVKPVSEVLNNYDTFRQRSIESQAMQRLEAPYRYDEYTSEIAKAIGDVTGASPLQVDHIMKGYTGGLGVMALGFLDYLIEGGRGPESRVSEPHTLPVVGSLFQRPDGGRALVDFYEMRDIAEQAAATQRAMAAQGIADSPENAATRAKKAAVEKATRPTDAALAKLRKFRQSVQSSSELSPAQKRDALNEIRRREIELVKPTRGMREMVR